MLIVLSYLASPLVVGVVDAGVVEEEGAEVEGGAEEEEADGVASTKKTVCCPPPPAVSTLVTNFGPATLKKYKFIKVSKESKMEEKRRGST